MSGLETNLKSTRPRPGHYETKNKTSKKDRDRDRDPENWSRDLHYCTIMYRVKENMENSVQSKKDLHSGPSVPRTLHLTRKV